MFPGVSSPLKIRPWIITLFFTEIYTASIIVNSEQSWSACQSVVRTRRNVNACKNYFKISMTRIRFLKSVGFGFEYVLEYDDVDIVVMFFVVAS